MQVRFFLTGEEVWRLSTFRWRRSRRRPGQIISGLIVIGLLVVLLLIEPSSEWLSTFLPILLVFLVLVLLVVAIRWMQRSRANRAAALQGEQIITISPEGFRHQTNRGEALIPWHTFKEITADHFALYFFTEVLNTSSTVVRGIPRRAFVSTQEADTFLNQALYYWRNSLVIPPGGPAGTGAPYERWG